MLDNGQFPKNMLIDISSQEVPPAPEVSVPSLPIPETSQAGLAADQLLPSPVPAESRSPAVQGVERERLRPPPVTPTLTSTALVNLLSRERPAQLLMPSAMLPEPNRQVSANREKGLRKLCSVKPGTSILNSQKRKCFSPAVYKSVCRKNFRFEAIRQSCKLK